MEHTALHTGGTPRELRIADCGLRICIVTLLWAAVSGAGIVTFDELPLAPDSYWNGADGAGGFTNGEVRFANHYNADWAFWDGFAYSNRSDPNLADLPAQYNAIAGGGQAGSANYAVAYIGWEMLPTLTLPTPQVLSGLYVTNDSYTYYAMLRGSPFSKKFGGPTGNEEDWFKLTITGKDATGKVTGTIDFYLADFRFADNTKDYLLDSWAFVGLRPLGRVKSLEFSLTSSDAGAFGMNTPAYFCLDSLISDPAPVEPAGPGQPFRGDPAINGYVDSVSRAHAAPQDPNAILNPLFRGWADGVAQYGPADDVWSGAWNQPDKALGPATGDPLDIVSLGELTQQEIDTGKQPGRITLVFGDPNDPNDRRTIRNGKGLDFAVFENGIISYMTTANGSVEGQVLAELAYVEVSSNGRDFVRFPSVALTPGRVGAYGTSDMGNLHNLAGKHPNAGGICTGTPFDLDDLAAHPDVLAGKVDLNAIHYVRLVDIPGDGSFFDDAQSHVDPNTWPAWANYAGPHPIFDQWPTWGSGGFDLEAIGVLNEQQYEADINLDGIVDAQDLDLMTSAWNSRFGDDHWIARCDLAEPKDLFIDGRDLDVLASQWGAVESWRSVPTGAQGK
ncbi:MAG: DUF4465 domain-containing protein [Planctomycetes bacterium]|nr:DUF4465 domain-containing protein [Planctomycetota bacterium]